MTALRAQLGIDDYSWSAFKELFDDSQNEMLLFLETLAPEFETHPERWAACFCELSRGFRTAQRLFLRSLGPVDTWAIEKEASQ